MIDLPFLPEHQGDQGTPREIAPEIGAGRGVRVDRDTGRVVPSILQATEAIEEEFEDVPPLSMDVVVEVSEDPAHFPPPTRQKARNLRSSRPGYGEFIGILLPPSASFNGNEGVKGEDQTMPFERKVERMGKGSGRFLHNRRRLNF